MLIQFPIWIALYDVIRIALGSTPESLIDLSNRLYPWSFIQQALPLGNHFLLWDLAKPDTLYVLPVLVAASMWIQQKLTMTQASMTSANQSQAQTNQTMLWMMPLMFGWFTLTVPSGLAIYWLLTNVVGIVMNYHVFGWKGTSLVDIFIKKSARRSKASKWPNR
jgi:Preprotein translocase subunit YidC